MRSFSLVNVARLAKLDAEDVLNGAIEKFRRRFSGMEAELVARGTSVSAVTPASSSRPGRLRKPASAARSSHETPARTLVHRHRAWRHHRLGGRRHRQCGELDAGDGHRCRGAIKRKGGAIIEEEAIRQGPVEVGEAVLTTGGNLPAIHIIHAAVMGPDLKTDAEKIAATTRAVLALAAKHRITSLALPRSNGRRACPGGGVRERHAQRGRGPPEGESNRA